MLKCRSWIRCYGIQIGREKKRGEQTRSVSADEETARGGRDAEVEAREEQRLAVVRDGWRGKRGVAREERGGAREGF